MSRVALLSVALLALAAKAASFHTHYQRQMDPFQNVPDVRMLGFCLTECVAVGEAQARQAFGDLSTACNATLASQVGNCMQCLGNSPLSALLTSEIKQQIQNAKTIYESQCAAASSPITIDIGTAFKTGSSTSASTSTATASTSTPTQSSASASTPTATPSSTGSVSTTVSSGYVHAPSFGIAAAAAIAVFAAI